MSPGSGSRWSGSSGTLRAWASSHASPPTSSRSARPPASALAMRCSTLTPHAVRQKLAEPSSDAAGAASETDCPLAGGSMTISCYQIAGPGREPLVFLPDILLGADLLCSAREDPRSGGGAAGAQSVGGEQEWGGQGRRGSGGCGVECGARGWVE
eukprot:3875400-Rhodomonas_salina.3